MEGRYTESLPPSCYYPPEKSHPVFLIPTPNERESSLINKKKRIKKPGSSGRPGLRIAVILLIGALLIGVFRLWACLNNDKPQLDCLEISKDGETLKLLEGEIAHFNPNNRIRIMDISTNICFNRGIRIVSEGLDVNSLLYGEVLLSDLLPDKDIYSKYTFILKIKRYNIEMGHVELVVEPRVEDWLDKANRIIDGDKKIEVLKKAQALFPDERRIRDSLIKEYTSQQKWDDAAIIFEKTAKEKPDKETLNSLLSIYENMSNTEGVISVLRKLIALTPEDVNIKLKLADALDKSGRTTDAVSVYEELLNSMKGQDLLPVYNSLGYLYARSGDTEKAISFYLKALELNGEDANLYHNLSLLYEKTGQKAKAKQYLAKAVQLKPGSQDDRPEPTQGLLEGGKENEAITQMKAILDVQPGDTEVLLQLAKLYEKQNKTSEALACYKKVLDILPENEDAQEAYLRLSLKAIHK